MQIGEVLKAIAAQFHAHIRAIGKGRVVVLTCGRRAIEHRVCQIGFAPAADAVDWIGRDIWSNEGSERRRKAHASDKHELVIAAVFGSSVAGCTTCCVEDLFARVCISD